MNLSERGWLFVGLGIGGLLGGAYLATAFRFRPDGGLAVELRDTYLFYQYAAAWSQGHPYAFMAGDPPSTGSTSHLYPALLGLFHALGARGDALSAAGGGLAFLSHLTCIALLWRIARRLAPDALPLAVGLCAASGHLAITLFDQTDATLTIPLALAAFSAFLEGRRNLLAAALVALSLTRPDGLVLALALLLATPGLRGTPLSRRDLRLAAGLGVGAFLATLAWNAWLTGGVTPHSVLAKGLFQTYPFFGAVYQATRALGRVFVELGLGIGNTERQMFVLPLVGMALAGAGYAAPALRGRGFERWFALAVLGMLAVGILGGVSGIHRDRYLAWLLPIALIYTASGARSVTRRLGHPGLFAPLAVLLVAYQAAGAGFLLASFAEGCARVASNVRFVKSLPESLPEGARLGMEGASGLAYFLPGHHVTHVSGMTTAAFAYRDPNVMAAEILKRRPELRFDYWLVKPSTLSLAWYRPLLGRGIQGESPAVSAGDAFALYAANWSALDEPADPQAAALISRLEVGWTPSEQEHAYRSEGPQGVHLEPLLVTGRLGNAVVADVGRVILGGESFRVARPPSGELRLVLRTASRANAYVVNAWKGRGQQFRWPSPRPLEIRVDGETVATPAVPLPSNAESLQEYAIPLAIPPGPDPVRIEIDGEYLSLGYRFYDAAKLPSAP